jgi:hypothetical protein
MHDAPNIKKPEGRRRYSEQVTAPRQVWHQSSRAGAEASERNLKECGWLGRNSRMVRLANAVAC